MAHSLPTAFKQIRRTPYQALVAILILTLTFFSLSLFILLSLGSHIILNYFESTPQAIAFFERGRDLPSEDLARIRNRLEATGELASFKYVSTGEAEKIYKDKNQNEPELNELVDANILPPSVEISAKNISGWKELKDILSSEPLVKDIRFYEDIIGQLSLWINNIRYMGLGMVGFLLFLSVLILIVIISLKVKNKHHEIEIMRLLGASAWYIHGPFLIEGMIYGMMGACFGWLGTFTALQYATPALMNWLQGIITLPVSIELLAILLGGMLLTGMIIGAFSSLLAVRRFLRI